MSLMRQVGLLAAGSQPWNPDICSANGDRFAYCATLAVYIYKQDPVFNEFRLWRIVSEHKKTITCISWHPDDIRIIATSGSDGQVIVWNIDEQVCVARLKDHKLDFKSIGWCYHAPSSLGLVSGRGPVFLWSEAQHVSGSHSLSVYNKDTQMMSSEICQFRWHPQKSGKLVMGHRDGSISIFSPGSRPNRHVLRPEELEQDVNDPVIDLQWDPLSSDYLLISNTNHGIRLVDTEALNVIMNFQLPSVAIESKTMAWIRSAPGMFLTGDANCGILRVWNVSKSTPMRNIKLKSTGFHSLFAFRPTNQNSERDDVVKNRKNNSQSRAALQSRGGLPPCHVVCTFSDGGVGLYNLGRRKWEFLRESGHVETIFDCKFKPDDASLLATASFDGTIKIWDVETMTAVHTSPGDEGVIYSISWAPADLNCLAACTIRNGAFIWDIGKDRIIQRFKEHGSTAIYCISWCERDSRRIATCGGDGYCIVQQVNGQVLHKYLHPATVYGCDWNPNNNDMIATTCDDKLIRVFYLTTNSDSPLKVFSGHTAKVFQVKWSPLRENLLCSGSDDNTIRLWDYALGTCLHVLVGHTGPVRGLLWNQEVPYLMMTGSWDYTIRVWDTRDGACVDTILDHGADVYGLSSHPDRPFTVASTSRDSTVRIWSLQALVQPLEINILTQQSWKLIMGTSDNAYATGAPPLLCGRVSKLKKQSLDSLGDIDHERRLRWFSKFFSTPGGVDNIWELVLVAKNIGDGQLSKKYSKGIMHMKHVAKYKASAAQEYEIKRTSKYRRGIGAPSVDQCLRQAANLHISLGHVQRYCELMIELGEWEKALSLAPGVSVQYWKSLMERRIDCLREESSDDVTAYCMASGAYREAVEFMTSQGQYQEAFTISQIVHDGQLSTDSYSANFTNGTVIPDHERDDEEPQSELSARLVEETSVQSADWYLHSGQPIRAACCHLAVNQKQRCISYLIRGNELELAVSLCLVLGITDAVRDTALELLAWRCEKIGKRHLAVDLLSMIEEHQDLMIRLCARFSASSAEINDLYEKAGLPCMEECSSRVTEYMDRENVNKIIRFGLLSSDPQSAMITGLRELKNRMSDPEWKAEDVHSLILLLSCYRNEKKILDYGYWLLIAASYVGALMAIRRNYYSIVLPLMNNARHLCEKESNNIPLSKDLIDKEAHVWKKYGSRPPEPTSKSAQIHGQLLRKCGKETESHLVGGYCTTGSQLPSHSDVHESVLSKSRIQGPAFFLEDGRSAISLNDALMWANVNPFSPLNSGTRINPF